MPVLIMRAELVVRRRLVGGAAPKTEMITLAAHVQKGQKAGWKGCGASATRLGLPKAP